MAEYQQLSRYGSWDRIDKAVFDLGMLGSSPERFRPLYTHPADQVAEGVVVPVDQLNRAIGILGSQGFEAWDQLASELAALLPHLSPQ